MVLHGASVMNLLRCARYLEWYAIDIGQKWPDLVSLSFFIVCKSYHLLFDHVANLSSQEFALEPVLPPLSARPDQVERALKARYHDAMSILQPQGKELDLLIIILPDNNGSLYGL